MKNEKGSMTKKSYLYLTVIHDVDGFPRAWGQAGTRKVAIEEAERQWAFRVAERTADGTLARSEERGKTITHTHKWRS